jgi:FlaA1/EpsC-like NDP-sugar epimerase
VSILGDIFNLFSFFGLKVVQNVPLYIACKVLNVNEMYFETVLMLFYAAEQNKAESKISMRNPFQNYRPSQFFRRRIVVIGATASPFDILDRFRLHFSLLFCARQHRNANSDKKKISDLPISTDTIQSVKSEFLTLTWKLYLG